MSCDEHLLSSEKISFAQFKFKIQVQEREREVLEKEFLEKTRFFMHFAAFALSKSLRHKEQLTLRALS